MNETVLDFFFPKMSWWLLVRLLVIVIFLPLFCVYVCRPAWVNGDSMLPVYHTGQFVPVWRPAYWGGRTPKIGDVVMIRLQDEKVMLLKRVVATEGQTVSFKNGQLYIDGTPCAEPWGHTPHCDWNLPERTVSKGCIYAVGDNRSMPIDMHVFGEAAMSRVVGRALW